MDIETIWYESSPYLYAVVGVFSLFGETRLALLSGGLLIAATLTILRMRWVYRRKRDKEVKKSW